MKILQINTRYFNGGSTGHIVYDLREVMNEHGIDNYVAFGFGYNLQEDELSHVYRIENNKQLFISKVWTKLTGHHGFNNKHETKKLLEWIDEIHPDLIHMHNIHNHYVNIRMLLQYIAEKNIPCVLTMHDCWTFTGHCAYFDYSGCNKWKTGCNLCPSLKDYPKTFALVDPSPWNYAHKRALFEPLSITFVTPSEWLRRLQQQSFLKDKPCEVIYNGIDTDKFRPTNSDVREKYGIGNRKLILAVSNRLVVRKGRQYLLELPDKLYDDEVLVIVGLTQQQVESLKDVKHLIPIERTETADGLIGLYSAADVFINPTLEDNFPTTNIEALACGTPVVTFDTGGSPEAIDDRTGLVVPKGDLNGLLTAIREVLKKGKVAFSQACVERAKTHYNKNTQYEKYIKLYESILKSRKRD